MLAMGIGAIALTAFWSTFQVHHKTYLNQEEIISMQQTLRVAMDMMARDIRLAGYDWNGKMGNQVSFFTLSPGQSNGYVPPGSPSRIQLAMDLNGDGDIVGDDSPFDANEVVSYGFSASQDSNGDGIANKGAARLGRNTNNGSGYQSLAENVQAIGFAYAFDADDDGYPDFVDGNNNGRQDLDEPLVWAVDADENGIWEYLDVNGDGVISGADLPGAALPAPGHTASIMGDEHDGLKVNSEQIRAVRIWLLVRSEWQDTAYHNAATYVVGRQVIQADDGYRRRLLSTTVLCRNMEL